MAEITGSQQTMRHSIRGPETVAARVLAKMVRPILELRLSLLGSTMS